MKNRCRQNRLILLAATVGIVASFISVPPGFADEPRPMEYPRKVERPTEKLVESARDSKQASDSMSKATIASTLAPAADDIRSALAGTVEAALSNDGYDDLLKHFVDADRTRLGGFASGDKYTELNDRIDNFRKSWKSKYNEDFQFSRDASSVLNDVFASINQGEIGARLNADAKRVASDEPRMKAGTAEAMKSSGVNKTDADSNKMFGGNTNKDIGRDIASVIVRASGGMPELPVPMIHELPNSWRIDVPDSIDGQRLHDNLLKHLTMVNDDRDNWPKEVDQAYRLVSRHMLSAIMETDSRAASK